MQIHHRFQKREKDKKDVLNANAELTQVVPIRNSEDVVEKVDDAGDEEDVQSLDQHAQFNTFSFTTERAQK